MGNVDFLANVWMLKFGSELRYGIRSLNVRTPVDIPNIFLIFAQNIDCGYTLEPPRLLFFIYFFLSLILFSFC